MMRRFMLLALILVLGISQTVQAGSYGCLTVGSGAERALLNLNTGKVRTFALPYFNNALDTYEDNYAGLVYSPDHLRAAFVRPDLPVDGKPPLGTLVIAPVNKFGEFGSLVVVHDGLPMPYWLGVADIKSGGTNFLWSSDGHYLFYLWREGERDGLIIAQYAAVASSDGRTQQTVKLPVQPGFSVESFSADNQFVKLIGSSSGLVKMALMKIPELTLFEPLPASYQLSTNLCDVWTPYCLEWSPVGHQFMLGTVDQDNQPHLLVMDAGQPQAIADLPLPSIENPADREAKWSPDAHYIAIATQEQTTSQAYIDIFGIADRAHLMATNKALMQQLDGDYVSVDWCDNQHLVYLAKDTQFAADFTLPAPAVHTRRATPFWFNGDIASLFSSDCVIKARLEPYTDKNQAAQLINLTNGHITVLSRDPGAITQWYGTIAAAVWPGGLGWIDADGVKLHTIDTSTLSADLPEIGGTSLAGRWLTFTLSNGDTRDLYVADVLVGSYQRLRQDVTSFQFAPDGRTLLVKPNPVSSNGAVAFLFPMGGGAPLALKNSGVALDSAVVWSPDGSQIAVIAQAGDFSYVNLFQRSGQFLTGFLIPLADLDTKTLTWYPNCMP